MIQVLTSVLYALFVVNLIASAGTEALASFFSWRSRLLFRNVRIVLNDDVTGLATEVYRNALIHPRSTGDDTGHATKRDSGAFEFAVAGNQRVGYGFITWALAEQPELLDVALRRKPAA